MNNTSEDAYKNLSISKLGNHYQRCASVILSYCKEARGFRALIGDHNHWWNIDREKGTAKLFYPDDRNYNALTSKYRTLYWTSQLFGLETSNVEKPYDFEKHQISEQIGGREDTIYHSFFLDLDKAKGKDIHDPGVIEWLETAIKFFADTFTNAGVKSFGLAFSGGGAYCVLHPRLGMIAEDEKERAYKIEIIQKAFDLFIGDVASRFFETYPEALGWVKFDKLNYDKKRQVKTILSIHKKYPYAVIPLDPNNPKINLKEASLPISDETIEKATKWLAYQDDIENFGNLLNPFLDKAKETVKKTHGTRTVTLESEEVSEEDWSPCIRNIIAKKDLKSGEGASRALSVLASYMRYVGVPEEKAFRAFQQKADEWNAETSNIFESWFGCEHLDAPECWVPSCEKMRTKGSGYPHPELGELEICTPDERCKEIKSPIQYHKTKESKKQKEEEKKSPVKILIEMALANSTLIGDQYNDGFAVVNAGANRRVVKLRGREFKLWLGKLLWESKKKGITQDALSSALITLEGIALFSGGRKELYNRTASYNGKLYYDMSDDGGRVIEIDSEGWRFTTSAPVLFRREQHQKAQTEPERGGDLNKLWNYLNFHSEGDKVLFRSALISMFFPGICHGMPVLHGPQGSGKTFSSACIKDIIDPSSLETQALSRDEQSLVIALYHNWLTVFDNVSEVKDWQSDILSRAITGAGLSKRRLYTDDEEQLLNFRRCVLINGLIIPLSSADAMDRSLLFKLKRFGQGKSEKELSKDFEKDKPAILGGLLDLLSMTLKIKEEKDIEVPPGVRLYDFAAIGEAAAIAAGEKEGLFMDSYLQKKADDNFEVVQSSLMGMVLYALIVENTLFLDKKQKWSGSPSQLLEIFNAKAAELNIDRRAKEWKGSPKGLTDELEKLKTNFKAFGVEIERGRAHEGRFVNIYVNESSPLVREIASRSTHPTRKKKGGDEGDEGDEETHTKGVGENNKKLVCTCGKHFDTPEVLHHHQANCKDYLAKQDLKARESRTQTEQQQPKAAGGEQ